MGFHLCAYCPGDSKEASSSDVILHFANGRTYMVPDMILHYVADHRYLPPAQFVDDVLHCESAGGERLQTKGLPEKIGYLDGEYAMGAVPDGFFQRLWALMNLARKAGNSRHTRGI